MTAHTQALAILDAARAQMARREDVNVPLDYEAMRREYPKQKAALTRAVKSGDPDRVVLACAAAVKEWNRLGRSWPDGWSAWQRALDDVLSLHGTVQLRDLD